jgi:hypothetical protein
MTLVALGLAWLAGIALAGWLEPSLPILGLLALPALAVVAHIRHVETGYVALLASGYDRREARAAVEVTVSRVLARWKTPA